MKCEHCGHETGEGDGWRPTDEYRAVLVEGVTDTIGKMERNGLFRSTTVARTRQERMWIRTWAEKEWRPV